MKISANTLSILLALILLGTVSSSFAEEDASTAESTSLSQPVPDQQHDIAILPPIVVVGEPSSAEAGTSVLTAEQIERLPARNSSINELLLLLPGIQASNSANLSTQGGEIKPPELSISGGKTYQNNYRLDGQGTNLILDPLNTSNPGSALSLPSTSQGLWLNTSMLKSATVLDHNISARYGDFSGGVLLSETKNPTGRFGCGVYYRTTHDDWTKFHVADRVAFERSNSETAQPRFDKYEAGVSFDLPLSDETGIILAVDHQDSDIPLQHIGTTKTQHRAQDSHLLKLGRVSGNDRGLALTYIDTSSRNRYFFRNFLDSDFTLGTDSKMLSASYLYKTSDHLSLSLSGSASANITSRSAPSTAKLWKTSPSKPWGALTTAPTLSSEGGYGDLTLKQKTVQLSTSLQKSFDKNELIAGLELAHIDGTYERPDTVYQYYTSKALGTTSGCGSDAEACVPGEQYLSARNIWMTTEAEATLQRISLYLEDNFHIGGHLTLRPGVRASRDDYMENTDIAPRFSATLDLFGDKSTELIGGANRYYSETLLGHKLREGIIPYDKETRTSPTAPWTPSPVKKNLNRFSGLDTPYTDELSAEFRQKVAGGILSLVYMERHGKDQFSRDLSGSSTEATRYYLLNNKGWSRYKSHRAEWRRTGESYSLSLNITEQKSSTNSESYIPETPLNDPSLEKEVYYHGGITTLQEASYNRQDFNQNITANIVYMAELPADFHFTNVARYRSGYKVLKDTGQSITIDSASYPVYAEVEVPSSWVFDWVVQWEKVLRQGHEIALSLEIYNVFNRQIQVDETDDSFELGRQLWLGAEIKF